MRIGLLECDHVREPHLAVAGDYRDMFEARMEPELATVTLLYSHQDQVTALPTNGRVLGSAQHCPIAMLAIGEHLIGVQAHPEFGAWHTSNRLLEERVDPIGVAVTGGRPGHPRRAHRRASDSRLDPRLPAWATMA